MSVLTIISNIKTKFFKSDEEELSNIISILDNYEPDLESGEGKYYKEFMTAVKLKDVLELKNALQLKDELEIELEFDLEMGDKRVIYKKVAIKEYSIMNYISFINIINYFIKSSD